MEFTVRAFSEVPPEPKPAPGGKYGPVVEAFRKLRKEEALCISVEASTARRVGHAAAAVKRTLTKAGAEGFEVRRGESEMWLYREGAIVAAAPEVEKVRAAVPLAPGRERVSVASALGAGAPW